MSTTPKILSSCVSKKRYSSEFLALKVVDNVKETRGTALRTYYCVLCNGWHLTHSAKKKPRKRKTK